LSVHQDVCPNCVGSERSPETGLDDETPPAVEAGDGLGRFVPVARFTNGAEAGFFAHELDAAAEIPARLVLQENFDARDGIWVHTYLLTVAESDAVRAAEFLQSAVHGLHADEEQPECEPRPRPAEALGESGGPGWIPVLLTLAAGSVAYWGVDRLEKPPRPPALNMRVGEPPPQFWDALATSPAPWTQRLENGRGFRRLKIDHRSNSAVMEEDRNGDGRFVRVFRFPLPARP
jgi:hypothetical protein